MASRWLLFTQLCIVAALAASAALYVHYLDPADSSFCGAHSGCEAVRRSGFSYFFGSRYLSLPLFGIAAYTLLLSLTLVAPRERSGSLLGKPHVPLFLLSGLGGAAGVALFGYQWFAVGELCWLCVIVDSAALCVAVGAFLAAREAQHAGHALPSPLASWAVLGLAALVLLAPFGWQALKPPPAVPPGVLALYQPDKINVVEFADFQCPHCRNLHATLKPLLAEYGERVHFVRLHRPLPGHGMAGPAARAAVCADAQGKGEAMADRLFTMELSPEAITAAGRELNLDGLRFATCIAADETTRLLQEHAAKLSDEELRGLPTTYIGNKVLIGARPEATLRDALEHASRGPGFSLSGGVYLAAVVASGLALGVAGRRRQRARSDAERAHGAGSSNP
jgi:uncharacterized membrane protein